MKELDLHGLYHHQVPQVVENFVNLNYKLLPVRIIIGRSTIMRNLVEHTLRSAKYQFEVPAHNPGEIIVLQ